MRGLIFWILQLFLFTANCHAAFQVSLPSAWEKIEELDDGAVYLNSGSVNRQVIVARTIDLAKKHMPIEELGRLAREINETREGVLAHAGIRDYTSLSFKFKSGPLSTISIEARYTGLDQTPSQVVEQDSFTANQMFQVVYVEDSSAIGDHERIDQLLKSFRPRIARKNAFAEVFSRHRSRAKSQPRQ